MVIWVINISFFLYSCSVYSCHPFLISSVSVRSILFLSFNVPIFAWNVPLVSLIFLKRSVVFPLLLLPLFLCIGPGGRLSYLSLLFFGTLHSDGCVFPYLSPLPFAFLLFSTICKASSNSLWPFCISFSWEWSWSLPPLWCHEPLSISSSGTLSIRSNPLNLFVTSTL